MPASKRTTTAPTRMGMYETFCLFVAGDFIAMRFRALFRVAEPANEKSGTTKCRLRSHLVRPRHTPAKLLFGAGLVPFPRNRENSAKAVTSPVCSPQPNYWSPKIH